MYRAHKCLAVVPARAGSKGIPDKNLRRIGDRSLVRLATDFAKKASFFDFICVSTDSLAIHEEVPSFCFFSRPPHLATDHARSVDVVQHALNFFLNVKKEPFDLVILLEPTSPFRYLEDLKSGIDLLIENGFDSVVSCSRVGDSHPVRMKMLMEDLTLRDFWEGGEPEGLRRQDQSPLFLRNGNFYITRAHLLSTEDATLYGKTTGGFVSSRIASSINIDNQIDLTLAQQLIREIEY